MGRENRSKRDAPVSYRPPERLRDEFRARVSNSGLSTNAFLTAAIFGQAAPRAVRTPSLDQKTLALLLSQTARISDRLGSPQVVAEGDAAHLAACRAELTEIRTCLMLALGRSP